jgi:hypothetical protein
LTLGIGPRNFTKGADRPVEESKTRTVRRNPFRARNSGQEISIVAIPLDRSSGDYEKDVPDVKNAPQMVEHKIGAVIAFL